MSFNAPTLRADDARSTARSSAKSSASSSAPTVRADDASSYAFATLLNASFHFISFLTKEYMQCVFRLRDQQEFQNNIQESSNYLPFIYIRFC